MAAKDIYVEIDTVSTAKGKNSVCGDLVRTARSQAGTLCAVCDGLGSGIPANLAAKLATSRLFELVDGGFSFRQAFERVINTVQKARGHNSTYVAMTAIFIRPDGSATILSYEAPPVIWISRRRDATVLETRAVRMGAALVQQSSCFLESGEALLAVTDGITQAGLGRKYPNGITPEQMCDFLDIKLRENQDFLPAVRDLHAKALHQWRNCDGGHLGGDDCTVCLLTARKAARLNIFTGPPADKRDDTAACREFLRQDGLHIVCGGTTASLLARHTGRELKPVDQDTRAANAMLTPPRFELEGIDLVTEGAVTLTQTHNVLNLYDQREKATSAVSQMLEMLYWADHIHFYVGRAENEAAGDILMRQLGVRQRLAIVKKLAEELGNQQKLVTIKYF